jgi:hypothetical protein
MSGRDKRFICTSKAQTDSGFHPSSSIGKGALYPDVQSKGGN